MTYSDPPTPPNQPPNQPPHHFPDYVTPNSQLSQTKVSAAAVTSLVLGILGCIPAIGSVLALVFGIVGMRATRNGQLRGRGLAIAGLILGLVGIVGWSIAGFAGAAFYYASKPAAIVANQFVADLSAGNTDAASKACDSNITPENVSKLADDMKSWGAISDLTLNTRHVLTVNGVATWQLDGIAEFTGTTKRAQFILVKQPDGSYKIKGVHFR